MKRSGKICCRLFLYDSVSAAPVCLLFITFVSILQFSLFYNSVRLKHAGTQTHIGFDPVLNAAGRTTLLVFSAVHVFSVL